MRFSDLFYLADSNTPDCHPVGISTVPFAISEKVLLLAVATSVILDIFSNVLNPNPFVAPLKGLLLVVVVISFRTVYSYAVASSFLMIFTLRELLVAATNEDVSVVGDATFFLRIFVFVTWLLIFYEKRDRTGFLLSVLKISIVTTLISILCQIIGMIFHMDFFAAYLNSGRGGYKGLFLSENDTAVFYLISFIYSLHQLRRRNWPYSAFILAGLILLGLGSKTALIGAFAIPFLYFVSANNFRSPVSIHKLAIRPRLAMVWAFAFSAFGIVTYLLVSHFNDLLLSINYTQLIRVYHDNGLLSSLLSFRDQKAFAYFASIRSPLDILFGLQLRVQPPGFEASETGYFMYETDLFDYLARVGLLGLALTSALVWRTALLRNWRILSPETKTLIIAVLLLGCTVGHTLISAINGMWIAFWLIAFRNFPSTKAPAH